MLADGALAAQRFRAFNIGRDRLAVSPFEVATAAVVAGLGLVVGCPRSRLMRVVCELLGLGEC
jgi:hypothetical protein